ncbi:hypothetical protein, partial [Fangia hongkongensis]
MRYRQIEVLLLSLLLMLGSSFAFSSELQKGAALKNEGNLALLDPFGFDNAYGDSESQTVYLVARSYDTKLNRFISQD